MQNDLPPIAFQARMLKRLATTENISMAEVIRRSIDQTLAGSRTRSFPSRDLSAIDGPETP